jgi:plasmid stabilization system protein ParE
VKTLELVWLIGADEDLTSIFTTELEQSGHCTHANQLVHEIESQLGHILRFPLIGRSITDKLRRVLIGKQRYGLYYEL